MRLGPGRMAFNGGGAGGSGGRSRWWWSLNVNTRAMQGCCGAVGVGVVVGAGRVLDRCA